MRTPGLFRFAVVALAIVGAISVMSSLFGAAGTAAAGAAAFGAALLVPLLFIGKFLFVMLLIGLFARGAGFRRGWDRRSADEWYSGRRPPMSPSGRQQSPSSSEEQQEAFDEWHRLAHARDEVDGWVEDL